MLSGHCEGQRANGLHIQGVVLATPSATFHLPFGGQLRGNHLRHLDIHILFPSGSQHLHHGETHSSNPPSPLNHGTKLPFMHLTWVIHVLTHAPGGLITILPQTISISTRSAGRFNHDLAPNNQHLHEKRSCPRRGCRSKEGSWSGSWR